MTQPDFPRFTLENLRRGLIAYDAMVDPVLKLLLAQQMVMDAEQFAAKVSYWADNLRRQHGQCE